MNKYVLLVLIFCHQFLLAQQRELDSLKRLFPQLPDTAKVNGLNDLSYKVIFTSPQQGETYAREALALSEKIDFPTGAARAYIRIGMAYDLRARYELAIEAYEKGLSVLDNSKVKNDFAYLGLYNGLGLAYSRKADYPTALQFFLKAIELADKTNSIPTRISVLLNIGLVYYSQKDYKQALEYFEKCKTEGKAYGKDELVTKAINNIGLVYNDTERYDEAIRYFSIALSEHRMRKNLLGMSISLTNLGSVYKAKGNYSSALAHLDEAEILKRKVDDMWGLIEVNDIRSSIYLHQHKPDQAEALIQSNLKMVNEINSDQKEMVYQRFYDLYKEKNDYKNALAWYIRKTTYHDSVFNETKSAQLAELQTLYQLNKNERDIIQLEKEKEAEHFAKNMTIILLIFIAILALCVVIFFRFRARKKQELFQIALELQQKKIENAALREEELKLEIDFKNKELASYTINFVQKSELMEELKRNLQSIKPESTDVAKKISGLSKLVESSYQVDREWEDFKMQFENVHHNFFRILKDRCPELTNGDLKLCALLKLNMNMKASAKVLGISPESVKTARYRLRKKFGLSQDDNLVDFILNIEKEIPEGKPVT